MNHFKSNDKNLKMNAKFSGQQNFAIIAIHKAAMMVSLEKDYYNS